MRIYSSTNMNNNVIPISMRDYYEIQSFDEIVDDFNGDMNEAALYYNEMVAMYDDNGYQFLGFAKGISDSPYVEIIDSLGYDSVSIARDKNGKTFLSQVIDERIYPIEKELLKAIENYNDDEDW